MKKKLSIILPSLIIFALVGIDHFTLGIDSMNFIVFIYLVFPFIFILQGIICSNSRNSMVIGVLLSSIAVLVSYSIWYNVANMTSAVVVYLILAVIAYFLSFSMNRKFI
jgi:hypothetical protein